MVSSGKYMRAARRAFTAQPCTPPVSVAIPGTRPHLHTAHSGRADNDLVMLLRISNELLGVALRHTLRAAGKGHRWRSQLGT